MLACRQLATGSAGPDIETTSNGSYHNNNSSLHGGTNGLYTTNTSTGGSAHGGHQATIGSGTGTTSAGGAHSGRASIHVTSMGLYGRRSSLQLGGNGSTHGGNSSHHGGNAHTLGALSMGSSSNGSCAAGGGQTTRKGHLATLEAVRKLYDEVVAAERWLATTRLVRVSLDITKLEQEHTERKEQLIARRRYLMAVELAKIDQGDASALAAATVNQATVSKFHPLPASSHAIDAMAAASMPHLPGQAEGANVAHLCSTPNGKIGGPCAPPAVRHHDSLAYEGEPVSVPLAVGLGGAASPARLSTPQSSLTTASAASNSAATIGTHSSAGAGLQAGRDLCLAFAAGSPMVTNPALLSWSFEEGA